VAAGAARLRQAAAADVGDLLALWRTHGGEPGATDSDSSVRALLAREPAALIVAEDGEGIAGSLIAAWDGWRGNLYRLVVREDRRRQGVATALVRAGEQRLRAAGAVRISALVDTHDRRARDFWAALGYEHQSDRARYLRRP
jgi:ribosomal protein S18 acetylase RimI-like enzyme